MKKIILALCISLLVGKSILAQTDTVEYEHRPFQFTFLFPPLSTNGIDNFKTINDVSLNLFIGVSGGVGMFEAASFINVDRFNVNGVQMAGFGNTVGGHVTGAQLSGFYNVTGAYVHGFQGTGFVNVAGSGMKGAQAAGFINVIGDTLDGFQGAGFVNVTEGSHRGVQVAGFGNVTGAGTTHFQGAGFFNVADKVKGVQLSGFINICDSIDGIPLSFISVVKKNGYRKFGFSVSEVQYANIFYKMGVKRLYNIYSFGKPFGPGSRWMFGAGLGTEIDLSEKTVLNVEGTVHQELWIGNTSASHFLQTDRLNLYNTVKVLFGWTMDNQVTIHLGPTFNVSVANSNPNAGQLVWHEIAPYSIYSHTSNNSNQSNVQMWAGLQGSISL